MKRKQDDMSGMEQAPFGENRNVRFREYYVVMGIFITLFVMLVGYLAWYNLIQREEVLSSPNNTRQEELERIVIRGRLLAAGGEVLAETHVDREGNESRIYPYGDIFAHVVGYATKGKTGLEAIANTSLLTSGESVVQQVQSELTEVKTTGCDVVTTLVPKLQKAANKALGDRDGAAVVMEPKTGKVLAMVSKPDYNPNEIDIMWDDLVSEESTSTVLLNRATQGLYPPGSVFKIITTLALMRADSDYADYSYDCDGAITQNKTSIQCYHGSVHGHLDLKTAFAKSCNGAFANIGRELSGSDLTSVCEDLLFNEKLPIPVTYNKSVFSLEDDHDTVARMVAAIGQGKTQVTPMHMALITAAIANKGVLQKPYLIDSVLDVDGETVKTYSSSEYGRLMTEEEAKTLTSYMKNAVESGTASALSGQHYSVAGKTGTAEYSDDEDKSHAWFVGFSNVKHPDIVVAIVVEGAGSGSEYAVPIAKEIFDTYYE